MVFPLALLAQDADPGRSLFENRCARCHGADGNGGELGPAITRRLASRNDQQLADLIHQGIPSRGMPPSQFSGDDLALLTRFLRSIQRRAFTRPVEHAKVETTGGLTLEGEVLNRGFDDLQLRTADHRIHLLRRAGERYREVTSQTGWPGYNGDPGGNRYTTLSQITPANVAQLAPRWIFTLPNAGRLEVTPVVADGIMYVTNTNECFALDAGTGAELWHYRRPTTAGFPQQAASVNRGAAVAGNRVFMETDDARVIALDRSTGELLWDTQMADWHANYFATSAPLVAGSLVVAGVGGGEHGARGFVAAFDQATGKEAWRFWTIPKPGEPGSETWKGGGIEHGGAPTWFTGTYDAELDTVYWPSGNPSAEYNGDDRAGDNLYSDCILALDAKTGKLKWYYQTTPHDLWDWDAAETPIVLDAVWHGEPRKLLLQANRNGFFYVFDRAAGKLLLAKPFVRELTWAKGIGADGRPSGIQPGAHRGRNARVSLAGWRHQLVLAQLQPGHRSALRADLREVQRLQQARERRMAARQGVSGRHAAHCARRPARADPAGHRYTDRRREMGAAAAWPRHVLGRHAHHRHGAGDLRRRERIPDGRRCRQRQTAMELPDQPAMESVADDLRIRRPPVHRRRRRPEHHLFRAAAKLTGHWRTAHARPSGPPPASMRPVTASVFRSTIAT